MEEHQIETNTSSQREPQKKGKAGWGQTIVSGLIGSVLTATIFVTAGDQLFPGTTAPTENQATKAVEKDITKDNGINVQTTSYTGTTSLADMVESASKAIVGVVNYQQSANRFALNSQEVESGTGSGVMYKIDGKNAYIVTNNHVIEGASKVEVSLYNGKTTTAEIVGSDALTDLAVLKIDASLAPGEIKFGDSSAVRAGEQVVAIGNPLGLDFSRTVTEGIISAAERTIDVDTSSGTWGLNVIQTDAAINPGNSGGALINSKGEVIGINSLKISVSGVEGLGFAIPSNDVIPIVDEMIKTGKVIRPYLGVGLADLAELPQAYVQNIPQNVKAGVMVTDVANGSAAEKGGLQQEDIITAMNGKEIKSAMELRKYLYTEAKVNEKVSVDVYRGNQKLTLKVTLGQSQ
ncbi:S1C family serine protease [Peribacillus loiseleuriae]|uniref:S1C family serine protease n=1 Tax=Peribacillus loiseleuriae TaxID=1679170 RepID=UPI003D03FA41